MCVTYCFSFFYLTAEIMGEAERGKVEKLLFYGIFKNKTQRPKTVNITMFLTTLKKGVYAMKPSWRYSQKDKSSGQLLKK